MSWSPELYIGEFRPWPDSVHVVRGKTEETMRYFPERKEGDVAEYIVELPYGGAADEAVKIMGVDGSRLYGYSLTGEIVRCRDCKYMHTVRHWLGMEVDECWLHADPESGALGKEPIEPDGFCAWGERKETA